MWRRHDGGLVGCEDWQALNARKYERPHRILGEDEVGVENVLTQDTPQCREPRAAAGGLA